MEYLIGIGAFLVVCGALFTVVRVIHPTRNEMYDKCQSKEGCALHHAAQTVRNDSFIHQLNEIKKDMKEEMVSMRADVNTTMNKVLEALLKDNHHG